MGKRLLSEAPWSGVIIPERGRFFLSESGKPAKQLRPRKLINNADRSNLGDGRTKTAPLPRSVCEHTGFRVFGFRGGAKRESKQSGMTESKRLGHSGWHFGDSRTARLRRANEVLKFLPLFCTECVKLPLLIRGNSLDNLGHRGMLRELKLIQGPETGRILVR